MQPDLAIARTAKARRKAEREADKLIAANDNKKPKPRVRYRGTRPAWNWLAKQDERAAALLWLAARHMLPEADNDNREPGMKHLDRRKDGRPRGPQEPEFDAGTYLALPAARSSPLSAVGLARAPVTNPGWFNAAGFAIKPQRQRGEYPSSPLCRFTRCVTGTAWQYGSLIETVGKARPGKSRGDVRRVNEPDMPEMPDDVFVTVEAMLSGATLAGVGEMHGARGGYADVKGKQAMLAAGAWALSAIDAPETRRAA
jgi:hypothetical protein